MRQSGFIAIAGRPNSGKSTLLNRVLGTKLSIVTPKAQTTRERVLGILTEKRGQLVFVDTPGIHKAKPGGINQYMVNEAKEGIEGTSLVWYLVDPDSGIEHERAVIELLPKGEGAIPVLVVLNKIDLRRPPAAFDGLETKVLEAARAAGVNVAGNFRISARDGKGVKELLATSWERIPEGPLYYPDEEQMSDRPVRFFVGEMIREQLFLKLGDELPYSCAVEIEKFDENSKPKRIEAVIHVERESQKGIVIGKGAHKIKEIGQAARKEIEKFMAEPVFLGLRVKVLKDWTRDAETLKRMGYTLPTERSA